MLFPAIPCVIAKAGATDLYGQVSTSIRVKTKCSIVKFIGRGQKTSVRADSSASRGAADEVTVDAVLLFAPTANLVMDDIIELLTYKLKVTGIFPRYTVTGELDHYQVEATIWA